MSYLEMAKQAEARFLAEQWTQTPTTIPAPAEPQAFPDRLADLLHRTGQRPPAENADLLRRLWDGLDAGPQQITLAGVPDDPVYLAQGEAQAAMLVATGIARGRIWTVAELWELFDRPGGPNRELVCLTVKAKLALDGDVVLPLPGHSEG